MGRWPVVTAVLLLVWSGSSGLGAHDENPMEIRPWPTFHEEALQALARNDVTAAIAAADRAARLAPPNHPYVLYAQLRAYTSGGHYREAFDALSLLVDKGVAADVLVAPSFEALREQPRWVDWQPRLQAIVAPASRSVVAFRLAEPDLIPDAMTYDRGSRRFLIGSLHKRKVIVVDEVTGRAADYATFREAGFLGVQGLEADNRRGALYVLSAGGPEMQGDAGNTEDQSFLHRLQLSSGRQVTRTAPPAAAGGHRLDDLVQARDGTLYVTDTRAGMVYRWRPAAKALEPFVSLGTHMSPRGLTWSGDGRVLYVAHLEGLSRIDLRTRDVQPVGHPSSMTLVGIDGLDTHGEDLIAVQNGLPGLSRVVRLRLTRDGLNVTAMDVLDANLPDHDTPSSGVVVEDGYYYVANSQRRRFTAPGVPGPPGTLQKPIIRRVNLR